MKKLKIHKIELEKNKIKGAEIRARTNDLVNLDKPSDYLYTLESIRGKAHNITRIKDTAGILHEQKEEIIHNNRIL